MKKYLIGILLTASIIPTMAQQTYTLKTCIDYSLSNHLSNQVVANNVEIAKQQGREALAGYLPQVNGSASFDYNIKRQTNIIPAGALSPTERTVQFGQPFMTNPMIQMDQVIYDQSLIYGIKANQPNKEIAALSVKQNQEDLIYNTTAAYIEAVIYSEKIRILTANEEKYKELLAIKKLQYEKGVATSVDYNRIVVAYKNIVAEKTLAQTNRELAMNKLKNAMGMSLSDNLAISDTLNYNLLTPDNAAMNFDVTNLYSYRINAQKIRLQEIDVQRKRAAYYPTLTGYARYGAQAYGATFNNAFDRWFDYSAIGVKLNVPIFNGFKRESQLSMSKLNLDNAKQNFIINNNNLQLQYLNANTQLQKSYNDVSNNKENLALAEEIFTVTNLEYQKGTVTITDLLNAEYSLKEAQNNYITSVLNLLASTLNNEKAKGTLITFAEKL